MVKAIKFKNKEEKKEAIIDALNKLLSEVGWQVCRNVLQERINRIDEKLRGNVELGEGETIASLQSQRKDRVVLLELPEDLAKDLEQFEDVPPEFDPYE